MRRTAGHASKLSRSPTTNHAPPISSISTTRLDPPHSTSKALPLPRPPPPRSRSQLHPDALANPLSKGGASSGRTPHLPTPPLSHSDHPKRSRSRSPGSAKSNKKQKLRPSPSPPLPPPHRIQLEHAKRQPPPPAPPPLPTRPSYSEFLLLDPHRAPVVRPSPLFKAPSSTPEPFAPVASTSRLPPAPNYSRSRSRPPPLFRPDSIASSTRSSPLTALSTSPPPTNRSSNRVGSAFSPSTWEFLRPAVKDRPHLSDDEVFDSDHDEWADGADPHYHDIASLPEKFEDREFAPWEFIEKRVKFRMNERNEDLDESGESLGFGMLPDPWGVGAMRKAEEKERRQEAEREEKKRKEKERIEKGKGKAKEPDIANEDGQVKETREERRIRRRKIPFLQRLKGYYDIDQPFTDDSEIESELDNEPAVGLGALAIPLIRPERERRKRRRREGKVTEDDDDTSDDD